MSDDYDTVQRGGLKLKGGSDTSGKKKKKKHKEKKKLQEQLSKASADDVIEQTSWKSSKTKTELAFEKRKKKRGQEEILERAQKNHKERIMEFNTRLDNLSEHFDIPKVSWTK